MPKCSNCGSDYISGELHCPSCFDPVPIAATPPVSQADEVEKSNLESDITFIKNPESDNDPFAVLFSNQETNSKNMKSEPNNQTRSVRDIRDQFSPTGEFGQGGVDITIETGESTTPKEVAQHSTIEHCPPQVGLRAVEHTSNVDAVSTTSGNAYLIVKNGQSAGEQFPISVDSMMIGRWDQNIKAFVEIDLTKHDPDAKISRKHARITFENGNYYVEDLGSTNGTYINKGDRLIPGNKNLLQNGDEIIIGKTFLKFNN